MIYLDNNALKYHDFRTAGGTLELHYLISKILKVRIHMRMIYLFQNQNPSHLVNIKMVTLPLNSCQNIIRRLVIVIPLRILDFKLKLIKSENCVKFNIITLLDFSEFINRSICQHHLLLNMVPKEVYKIFSKITVRIHRSYELIDGL